MALPMVCTYAAKACPNQVEWVLVQMHPFPSQPEEVRIFARCEPHIHGIVKRMTGLSEFALVRAHNYSKYANTKGGA